MERVWRLALVWVAGAAYPLAGAVSIDAQRPGDPHPSAPLVFDGATVVDVEQGKLLPDQRVIIVGNRIQAVGARAAVAMPAGAQVVPAEGQYLIPGLWDLHTHGRRLTPFFDQLFIANGVTGLRDANTPVPLDSMRRWRQAVLAGERVGPPRQLLSGPALNGTGQGCGGTAFSGHLCIADSAEARRVIDSLKAAGVDMLKVYSLSHEMYFTVAAEARRAGLLLGGHTGEVTPSEASDHGAVIADHLFPPGEESWGQCVGPTASEPRCGAIAERFRRNGTWWVPTLAVGYLGDSSSAANILQRLRERVGAFWGGALLKGNWLRDSAEARGGQARSDSSGALAIVHRVGMPILAGTDQPLLHPDLDWEGFVELVDRAPTELPDELKRYLVPGFALHAELAIYVAEGLTPLEALQTATLNPAKMLHATDSLGTVAPGKLADLVLLGANPLDDITNTTLIRAVVANGRYYDRPTLDRLLVAIQQRRRP